MRLRYKCQGRACILLLGQGQPAQLGEAVEGAMSAARPMIAVQGSSEQVSTF